MIVQTKKKGKIKKYSKVHDSPTTVSMYLKNIRYPIGSVHVVFPILGLGPSPDDREGPCLRRI